LVTGVGKDRQIISTGYGKYIAKCMFVKQCKIQKTDPFIAIFEVAEDLYSTDIIPQDYTQKL